jgi:hypothetical protein
MKSDVESIVTSIDEDINALLAVNYFHLDLGEVNSLMLVLLNTSKKVRALKSVARSFDEIINNQYRQSISEVQSVNDKEGR